MNQRVLIVESSPSAARSLRQSFERAGFEVQCVRSASGVRTVLEHQQPLAVVLSFDIAEVDEILFELDFREAEMPIVALSSTPVSTLEHPLVDEVIARPADPRSVVEVVSRRTRSTRVLLVDDDDIQRTVLGLQLTEAGYRVRSARDGHEALSLARSEKPDVVLTDIMMPGIDGYCLCAAIRADESLSTLPVVLATTRAGTASDRQLAADVGASSWVVRDTKGRQVLDAVFQALALPEAKMSSQQPARSQQAELVLERGKLVAQLATTRATLATIDVVLDAIDRHDAIETHLEDTLTKSLASIGFAHGAIWLTGPHGQAAVKIGYPTNDADARAWTEAAQETVHARVAFGLQLPRGTKTGMFATAPICGRGEVLGAVVLAKPSEALADSEWVGFTRSFGRQLGQALDLRDMVARAEAAERRALERATMSELVAKVNFALAAEDSLENAIAACTLAMEKLLSAHVQVWRMSDDGTRLEPSIAQWIDRTAGSEMSIERPLVVEGRILGIIGVATNQPLTDEMSKAIQAIADAIAIGIGRKRSEGESRTLRHQLARAQKLEAVSQLAGGIAHDTGNMLAIVLASLEMLVKELGPDDPRWELVEEIRSAAYHSAGLTRQLMAFSREQAISPAVIDINEVVVDFERLLKRVIGKHISFRVVLAGNAGSAFVDRGQLEQVLVNLVMNARDAIVEIGSITVETCRRDDRIFLSVRDTGTGMDATTKERIFDPFYTTKSSGSGSGLGLAMVRGFVNQVRGAVHVESALGEGSVFTVELPAFDDRAVNEHSA